MTVTSVVRNIEAYTVRLKLCDVSFVHVKPERICERRNNPAERLVVHHGCHVSVS